MRQRLLGLAITAACIAGVIVIIWQIGLGSTLVKVEGKSIRSGAVKGVESYLEYMQTGSITGDKTAGLRGEEKAAAKDMALVQQNSVVNSVFIPLEVLKLHFAATGKVFPDEEALAEINEYPDSLFSNDATARMFSSNGVKKEHALYYHEYIAAMGVFRSEVLENDPVSDEEIQAYYDEHMDYFAVPFSMRASHILILDSEHTPEKRAEIEAILEKLNSGEDFAELAKAYSEDSSAESGGDLGTFRLGDMVEPFEKACLALEPGETSGIVETEFGFHIIKLTEKTEEGFSPLAEVRDSIESYIGSDRVIEALDALRAQWDIRYYGIINPTTGKPPISLAELDEARGTTKEEPAAEEAGAGDEAGEDHTGHDHE